MTDESEERIKAYAAWANEERPEHKGVAKRCWDAAWDAAVKSRAKPEGVDIAEIAQNLLDILAIYMRKNRPGRWTLVEDRADSIIKKAAKMGYGKE